MFCISNRAMTVALMYRLPNPRLQRTRAAVLLQSLRGKPALSGAVGRAPLSRKPLGLRKSHIAVVLWAAIAFLSCQSGAPGRGTVAARCAVRTGRSVTKEQAL